MLLTLARHTLTFLTLALLLSLSTVSAQNTDFQKGQQSLQLKNGYELKSRYSGIEVTDASGKTLKMERPSVSHVHLALFPDLTSENHFYSIASVTSRNTGMALLRYNLTTGKLEELLRTHERLRPSQLRFRQRDNGDIFVISNQGVLLRFHDNAHVDRHAIQGFYQAPSKMFQPIYGLIAGEKVLFYSTLESGHQGKALRDVVVFDGEGFRRIDLKGASISSAQLADGKLQLICDRGFLNVDLKSGETDLKIAKLPELNGEQLELVKSFNPNTGNPIGLFQRPWSSSEFYGIENFDDGYLIQIGELIDGTWQLSQLGLETSIRKWNQKFFEEPNGRIWIAPTHSGRFVVREINGNYRRLASVPDLDGFPLERIWVEEDSLQVQTQISNTAVSFPIDEVLKRKKKEYSDWIQLRLRTPLILCGQGDLYAISIANGGKLLRIADGNLIYEELPPPNKFKRNGYTYISADTDGNVWLFSDQQNKTAVLEDGEWTVFEPKTENGETLTHKQVAFEDRARKVAQRNDYQIGFSGNFIVRFAKGKQVVFKNRQNRVAYFDGEKWHAPTQGTERGYRRANAPFIYKNLICYIDRKEVVGMTRSKFLEMENVNDKRPWRTVPMSEKLRMRYSSESNWKPERPTPEGRRYSYGRNWFCESHGKEHLYIALENQTWSRIQKPNTPLENFRLPYLAAKQGDLFVFRGKKGLGRSDTADRSYYLKRFAPVFIQQEQQCLGEFSEFNTEVMLPLSTNPANRPAQIRFRLEDGEWSEWQNMNAPIQLPKVEVEEGLHTLEVQYNFDEDLVITQPLKFTFRYTEKANNSDQ